MKRFNLVVLLEGDDGRFGLWSRHRSSGAAEESFRACGRQWPGDRVIILDTLTGERKQMHRDGAVEGPFKGPVYDGGRYRWIG